MRRHFATLFDSAYAHKGLALYHSLERHSTEPFMLHVLACDDDAFWLLAELNMPNIEIVSLPALEQVAKLQGIRATRTWTEYLWTLASVFMEYTLPGTESITYLDADLFFFSDPKAIFDEIGERSIGIVPHRFADKDRPRLAPNGEYNVGVLYAKNSEVGRRCITRWAEQCREWCYYRNEPGKFADQKYLDDWPAFYGREVAIITNLGVNLGPWSIGNFRLAAFQGRVFVSDEHERVDELVAYHYHEFRDREHLTRWPLRETDKQLVYEPYLGAIGLALNIIAIVGSHMRARKDAYAQCGA